MERPKGLAILAVVLAALIVSGVIWFALLGGYPRGSSPQHPTPPPLGVTYALENQTSLLGTAYTPGAVQILGSNSSTVFLGGIGVFDKPRAFTLPSMVAWSGFPSQIRSSNVTSQFNLYFAQGGVFGALWNGTAWMFTGETTYPGYSGGSAVSYAAGHWTNLTATFAPFFTGGGIWAVAWNGTSWLLGGNDSNHAVLVSVSGAQVHDLTPLLVSHLPFGWVQMLAWNGTGWLVGGHGLFGSLGSGRYTDLLPAAPYLGDGTWAADWNGSAWVIGGGRPASVAVLQGLTPHPGPTLPTGFDQWVGCVVYTSGVWVLAGKGSSANGSTVPELVLWNSTTGGSGVLVDAGADIPGAFTGGQIQAAAHASVFGNGVLLVGQGWLDPISGRSVGAVALLDVEPWVPVVPV